MNYKATISEMKFKQVEVKGNAMAILTVKWSADDTKSYFQDLWVPSESTSEKATDFFNNTLETMGVVKSKFSEVLKGNWKGAIIKPDMVFDIETEVDKNGYEKVKYVNDPDNPVQRGGAEVTDGKLLAALGIDQGEKTDEIPF